MTNATLTAAPRGGEYNLTKDQITDHLQRRIAEVWNTSPYKAELAPIEIKIEQGIVLTEAEKKIFIAAEELNTEALAHIIPAIIDELRTQEPRLTEVLIGRQTYLTKLGSKTPEKFLIFVDKEERFFVDLFFFAGRTRTAVHNHNASCVSYQIEGNLREAVYKPHGDNLQDIAFTNKPHGSTTIVTPYDEDRDKHAILNDSFKPAATLHIYSQRVLGDDGVVKINRSNAPLGPTSVKKYLSGQGEASLVLYKPIEERIKDIIATRVSGQKTETRNSSYVYATTFGAEDRLVVSL